MANTTPKGIPYKSWIPFILLLTLCFGLAILAIKALVWLLTQVHWLA